MKKERKYENRVKTNAIIIFLLASLLCTGMIYHIVNVKNSIHLQRENINKNENILNITNDIIENVNKAQSYANLISFSGNDNNIKNFNTCISRINELNKSFSSLSDDNSNKEILNKIVTLLKNKEKIINEIDGQFNSYNPYQDIYNVIEQYQGKKNPTSSTVNTVYQDTIVYKSEKKSFFKRLGEVFSPSDYSDSIVLVSKTTIDTINSFTDNSELLTEIQSYTTKDKNEYLKRIKNFEIKYNNLILSDQEISQEISDLLLMLHKQTLDSVVEEIQRSEDIVNKNINLSITIASIALIIILTFIILIFNNIKKVIIARKATEEAKKRTEEIMESRHKLLLSVSHDIKAPLSSILGYLELMQIDNTKDYDNRKISSMKNSAEHILSLLTNLLNFSRLDQGKESLIISEFNIKQLCDELSEMFSPLAKNKHLKFIYENKIDKNIFIKSDALKIKQITSNILSNAIKYTSKGNVTFKININDNHFIAEIIDEGIGISKDKLDDIYKPFKRIENNDSTIEGSGFGLFVTKGLLELLNGTISADSELGKGSRFTIKIPVEITEEICGENEINQVFRDFTSENRKNILVIDDDITLLNVIESMIVKIGDSCDICKSSFEFENFINKINDYDLILTDREMGAFNGLEVLKRIKDVNPEKKVILMTARSEYSKENISDIGFDNYITKPFSIKDLAQILKSEENKILASYELSYNSKYYNDFPDLCSMFDNDDEAITTILKTFVETCADNLVNLNEMISVDNFNAAAQLCHKMRPMFALLNQQKSNEFMMKMDQSRDSGENSFPNWKEESLVFMNDVDTLIEYIEDKFDIE